MLIPNCTKTESTELFLEDPDGLRESSAWAELVVYADECPSGDEIVGNTVEPVLRKAFPATDPPPEVGTLGASPFGFALLVKTENCEVIGYGCTKADLKTIRSVTIKVSTLVDGDGNVLDPIAVCGDGQACVEGLCAEPEEAGGAGGTGGSSGGEGGTSGTSGGKGGSSGSAQGGSAGASGASGNAQGGASGASGSGSGKCGEIPGSGCTMQLVNTVSLPAAAVKGASLGGPAIVATKTGFVAAFHEQAQGMPTGRLVLVPISTDGCTTAPNPIEFPECSSTGFDPGVGMAWNDGPSGSSGVGMVALSRQACPSAMPQTTGGIGFFRFGPGGQFVDNGSLLDAAFNGMGSFAPNPLYLTSRQALSRGPGDEEFRVTYVQKEGGSAKDTAFTFAFGSSGPSLFTPVVGVDLFGGTTSAVSAYGGGAFVQALNVSDAGVPKTAIKLVPPGTTLDAAKVVTLPLDASELAVAAIGGGSPRLALLSKSGVGDVKWGVYGSGVTEEASGSLGQAKGFGIDVAQLASRLVFVVGQTGGLKLTWQQDSAEMSEGSVSLDGSKLPSLTAFDGKRLAAAATAGRVAVAWLTQPIASGDPVGGVALFRCE